MAKSLFDLITPSAKLALKGPGGESLPVTLTLQGLAVATIKQKALEANIFMMQIGKTEDPEKILKHLMKAEQSAAEMAGLAIVGWDNDEYMGEAYTPEYAKKLMKMEQFGFIRKQVNEFINDASNFFRDKPELADTDTDVAA